ncbi:Na+/H+ antiporter NhaA [Janibacter sp. G56]|uniref:Na+/H+ antiporter NhaA n=1 Tax=Janibacter sp. G56 TaxID=3418717 RepID=UPI003D03396E
MKGIWQDRRSRSEMFSGQVSGPLRSYLRKESSSAGLLVVATLLALLWANSPRSGAYTALWETPGSIRVGDLAFDMDLRHWINDGLMAAFFFMVGLEVRHEFALGELTERRRLIVPLVAGLGGMLVPAALYLAINPSGEAAAGWGIVIGTDTAFMLGALAIVGPAVATQLRVFLLTLTVIDDIVAVSVIGLVYSDELHLGPLALAAGCLIALRLLDALGAWRSAPYILVVLVLWGATVKAGLHASIAGMLAGLLVPAFGPNRDDVERAATQVRAFRQSPRASMGRTAARRLARAISVNERLQELLHGATGYVIVPLFALANAGVDLRGGVLTDALHSRVTWGVVVGLVLGKLVGIGLGSILATRLRWGSLPQGVGQGHVLGGAALSGIGFTVSLLIIHLAFDDEALQAEATVGVLIAAALAIATGAIAFQLAARLLGQRDATLPTVLDPPVDPATDHTVGRPDAPLVVVEYVDFECPFCAALTGVGEDVRRHFGDDLLWVSRHLPLPEHPRADLAALAAEAAGRQGHFHDMHKLLLTHQSELDFEDLVGYAGDLGLDMETFVRDLDDEDVARAVRDDVASAEASGARQTPTFFVGGMRHTGPHDSASLIAALEATRKG